MVNHAEVEVVLLKRHNRGRWRLRTAAGPGTSATRAWCVSGCDSGRCSHETKRLRHMFSV